jgi:hypothetical protein
MANLRLAGGMMRPLQRFAVELNRHTIVTVAPAQEAFSVRGATEDVSGSITAQTAVRNDATHSLSSPAPS